MVRRSSARQPAPECRPTVSTCSGKVALTRNERDMAVGDRYGFTYIRSQLDGDGVLPVTLERPDRRIAVSPEMHAVHIPMFQRLADVGAALVVMLLGDV